MPDLSIRDPATGQIKKPVLIGGGVIGLIGLYAFFHQQGGVSSNGQSSNLTDPLSDLNSGIIGLGNIPPGGGGGGSGSGGSSTGGGGSGSGSGGTNSSGAGSPPGFLGPPVPSGGGSTPPGVIGPPVPVTRYGGGSVSSNPISTTSYRDPKSTVIPTPTTVDRFAKTVSGAVTGVIGSTVTKVANTTLVTQPATTAGAAAKTGITSTQTKVATSAGTVLSAGVSTLPKITTQYTAPKTTTTTRTTTTTEPVLVRPPATRTAL